MTAAGPRRRTWRRDVALALVVVLGLGAVAGLARRLEAGRPSFATLGDDDDLYLTPEAARRLAGGFNGLAADWYWLRALQYIGRRIEASLAGAALPASGYAPLDRIEAVNPRVLVQLLRTITTLDPAFVGVYEFAAVVLPAVDAGAAIALVEEGIRANPGHWYLHQQLAYIHWQRGDFFSAAEAFRRGARLTGAPWMARMAERMEERGADRTVAREMYRRMYEQASDPLVKRWAVGRLVYLRWLDEQDAVRRVLAEHRGRAGACPAGWAAVALALQAAGLRTTADGTPVDPTGVPYVLVHDGAACDVALGPRSEVPAS